MTFDQWIREVAHILSTSRPGITTDQLDADIMYQAWSNGVSPQAFASTPTLPYRTLSKPPQFDPPQASPPPLPKFDVPYSGQSQTSQAQQSQTSTAPSNPNQSAADRRSYTGYAVAGLVSVAFFAIILISSGNKSGSPVASPSTSTSNVITKSPPKPLTEAQKYERARAIYASWTGNGPEYASGIALLKEIPKTSKQYSEARSLLDRWTKRKKDAELRAEKERKREEARQREAQRVAAVEAVKREREEAKYFTGDGAAKVSVGNVMLKRSTQLHVARGNSTFVYVYVSVLNEGSETIHANPNDFTLADTSGNTASHESDTYSLGNYFDAVNLRPGQQTGGWLVFFMLKDKRYTLTRSGGLDGPDVIKSVIP